MSRAANRQWNVRASALAQNTHNPIRDIIENLNIKPNPEKCFIPLSVGDPTWFGNLSPVDEVFDAIRESLTLRESRSYGPLNGHYEARKAIVEYSKVHGNITTEDVIICSGCSHAIELVVATLAGPGQNIVVPRPGYAIYRTVGEGLGIEIKYYDLLPKENWKVDLNSLENAIDDETAAIVVNNPSNPCGSVYSKEHLREILAIASKLCVPIIADEIYEHMVFSSQKFTPIAALSEDVPILTCSGLTKRFLVPGWRLGWIIINDRNNVFGKELRRALFNMTGRILGANTLIQQALPRILKSVPQTFFDNTMDFMECQAKLAYRELQKAPGLRPVMPQGSMYMMVEIKMVQYPRLQDDLQFIKQLCEEQSVLCIPGQCFTYPGFMRIVLTVPEDVLKEACARIIDFCYKHRSTDKEIINLNTTVNEKQPLPLGITLCKQQNSRNS